ncbi:MAG: serine/threonine protein kinase, partial [Candidatus Brocadiae bacterium]|nr:serine/threonine protein kinase [Candidatus Brocadiia bacterium]
MNENIQQEFRELEPGEIFDQRYRIVQELGRGGMGIVYKAMDQKESSFLSWACAKLLKKQKYVAIKLIFGNHTSDEESLLRFKREVKRLSQTHHPYIVRFHDAHLESPPYYYTMEYVEGKTLESIIKTVRKNSFWVAETFEKIACALQHIHDKGIVHRDIKPGNIILLEQGQIPKLMDFGLAKSQETPSITATNEILGSPDYMSPEQIAHAQGQKLDQRSDIFSLGITLYEVLTGIR